MGRHHPVKSGAGSRVPEASTNPVSTKRRRNIGDAERDKIADEWDGAAGSMLAAYQAAEIQRRLLPTSLTCEAGQFTVAGAVEPAGDVGGDTFDYSLDRDTLHMSLTDGLVQVLSHLGPDPSRDRGGEIGRTGLRST
jgi:hypothetical protein